MKMHWIRARLWDGLSLLIGCNLFDSRRCGLELSPKERSGSNACVAERNIAVGYLKTGNVVRGCQMGMKIKEWSTCHSPYSWGHIHDIPWQHVLAWLSLCIGSGMRVHVCSLFNALRRLVSARLTVVWCHCCIKFPNLCDESRVQYRLFGCPPCVLIPGIMSAAISIHFLWIIYQLSRYCSKAVITRLRW